MELTAPIGSLGLFVRRFTSALAGLGIKTVGDALRFYPFRYEDLSRVVQIGVLTSMGGQNSSAVTVRGVIKSIGAFRSPRKKILIVQAILSDDTGSVLLTWFGQRHLVKILKPGDELLVSGIPAQGNRGLQFVSPDWEPVRDIQAHVGRIVPVYSVGGNLTPKAMRAIMLRVLPAARDLSELLPETVRRRVGALSRSAMTQALHFPESFESLRTASRSRDFEQLFLLALGNVWLRADLARHHATRIHFDQIVTKAFVSRLPFVLTDGQRKAAWQILRDMIRERPMNRLLDGDVGSGKTLVATIAALNAARAGAQTAFLAPTGVLALQHFETLQRYLATEDVSVALLTAGARRIATRGKVSEVGRDELLSGIARGGVSLVVGTHALLEDDVRFAHLALAVVDEQHRFGVAQRKVLSAKTGDSRMPHLLSMTATPIPRTLSLTAFGDLDLSVIPERPPGRLPVKTSVVVRDKKFAVAAALRAVVRDGRQAFVVCPKIGMEDDSSVNRRSVVEVADELSQSVPELRLSILHGKFKSEEKERIMAEFLDKKYDVLISTTVIEVGVDVPNATLMIVEGAENFGLAQLHQLRGRVGRGSAESACLLVPSSASPDAFRRLKMLESCYDGWRLAQHDLASRGPGELLGTAQTGFGELSASALANTALCESARGEARRLLAEDPELSSSPELLAFITARVERVQFS